MDLREYRNQSLFEGWLGSVPPERIAAAKEAVQRLIDQLIEMGPKPDETAARAVVKECVLTFNELNDGWICTIEREDISDTICEAIELCGLSCDEDWLEDREW